MTGIQVEVVRNAIKNLQLGVYLPNGRVRMAVPLRTSDETIRLAVISRLGWIRRQKRRLAQQHRQSQREMVTGESHHVLGQRYRLHVVEQDAPPTVAIRNSRTPELRVRPEADREKREQVLQRWHRQLLREQIPALLAKWEPIIGVDVAAYSIKRMKTRWGTCNIEARRIWLNLELAKKPPVCLEYILVDEIVYLLERHHNDRFREYMDAVLPQWRLHRDLLNRAPLAHEDWKYQGQLIGASVTLLAKT